MIFSVLGPVSSGKTVELVILAHQLLTIYGKQKVRILKPSFDTRYERDFIKSASGVKIEITDLIPADMDIRNINFNLVKFIILDEIQFFTPEQISQLHEISIKYDINVYSFGLMKDFRNKIFPASKAILEISDKISIKKTFCVLCPPERAANDNAHISMKIFRDADGNLCPTTEGNSFGIGGIETYIPCCSKCFNNGTNNISMGKLQ